MLAEPNTAAGRIPTTLATCACWICRSRYWLYWCFRCHCWPDAVRSRPQAGGRRGRPNRRCCGSQDRADRLRLAESVRRLRRPACCRSTRIRRIRRQLHAALYGCFMTHHATWSNAGIRPREAVVVDPVCCFVCSHCTVTGAQSGASARNCWVRRRGRDLRNLSAGTFRPYQVRFMAPARSTAQKGRLSDRSINAACPHWAQRLVQRLGPAGGRSATSASTQADARGCEQ